MTTPVHYLPDMGKPPGKPRPGSIGHLVGEPSGPCEILLIEWMQTDAYGRLLPKADRHLAIGWIVGERSSTPVWMLLHVLQERGFQHLTNWGPMTKFETDGTRTAVKRSLGSHTLQTRNLLKDIARNMPVQVPDGHYNCQHWVWQVLSTAVAQGLLTQATVNTAWNAFVHGR